LRKPARVLLRNSAVSVAAISQKTTKRGYVSETLKNNAQVNVDTAIRADQKAFFAETGKLPESKIVPGTNVDADAMMSPMAGKLLISEFSEPELTFFPSRCIETSYHYG